MCRFFFFSLPKTAVTRLGAEQIEASMSPKSCGVVYFASLSGRSYLSPGERSVNCDALIGCSRWGHRPSGTLYCSEFHKERSRLSVFTRQPGTRPATECPGYMAPADLLTRLIRDRAIPCPSMRITVTIRDTSEVGYSSAHHFRSIPKSKWRNPSARMRAEST